MARSMGSSEVDVGRLGESMRGLRVRVSPRPSLSARTAERVVGAGPTTQADVLEGGDGRVSRGEAETDTTAAVEAFISSLLNPDHSELFPHLMAIGYELEALVSIYSPQAVRLSPTSRPPSIHRDALSSSTLSGSAAPTTQDVKRNSLAWLDAVQDGRTGFVPAERIRYEVTIPAWEAGDALPGVAEEEVPTEVPDLRVLVSLPPSYPDSSPPQLQLLGRYLGSFPIDAGLFGDITRTYISSSGVTFAPGDVCVFEGLTYAQKVAREWYAKNLSSDITANRARDQHGTDDAHLLVRPNPTRASFSYSSTKEDDPATPQSVKDAQRDLTPKFDIVSSEPLTERRSTFVGHAVRVTDEREVPLVVYQLLEDKKIAKAHHPAIFAYRIVKVVGGAAGKVYSADHDDDGESQAGARLQHLLDILELENVLVVVTRWYGGTLLGADRFKYINQVARDALELGGFLDDKEKGGKGKGKRK